MANETTVAANGPAAMTKYRIEAQQFLKTSLVISKLGTNTSIGANEGQTISEWRPTTLAAVTSPFSEGVGPAAATVLTGSTFTATLAQVGAYATPSDMFELTGRDKKLQNYMDVFKYQAALSADTLAYNMLLSNATAAYAGGETSATFSGTAVMTGKELRRMRRLLARNNVQRYKKNGMYAIVVHPDQTHDLFNEDVAGSITDVEKRNGGKSIFDGDARPIWGFDIAESTVISTTTINGNTGYQALVVGEGAFLNVNCSAMPIRFGYVPANEISAANTNGVKGVLSWTLTYANLWVGSDGPRAYILNTGVSEGA